ncbi:Glycosyl transferase group 1 [Candidatus Competibacter denitrificans Run_A_D11]|uniref:Glycosyl transferase group 1 n=1 Tax=Candidatus Competibacter denitrificans Run_A_D11 TaxID=1400863 RepID=W6M4Q7_9GAMM|nr:glycosyltransferase [Candidatus Competibacter denitrificans]CDI00805.1 Glycosyl transferase group 1 [Candidatus Competibacter denitrificans Run_A_D11]
MRIAYLCKRQYMSHDVIVDRYARLYEQPRQLALRGHEVLGLCFSYRATQHRDEWHTASPGRLRWVGLTPDFGGLTYPIQALRLLHAFSPDIMVGASDAPIIVLTSWLAGRLKVPLAVDLYDHFESFGLSRLPGLVALYRRALRRAAVVTCVSEPLADLVRTDYRARGAVLALPSTIDRTIFYPRDRRVCRKSLGLPPDAKLIGTAGGLSREKGIEPLYRAFEQLSKEDPNVHLVLAGPLDRQCPLPDSPRIHYLGVLPHAQTAELFNMLDVGVVYLRDTPYGRYSFPQKAYEMVACEIPLAVACVGSMASLFQSSEQILYDADDISSLARCLKNQLMQPELIKLKIQDWSEIAIPMEQAYLDCIENDAPF